MMLLCECDFLDGFCGLTMPVAVYDVLSTVRGDDENSDLFIVHKDHMAGEEEIQREGEWVLVRAASERG